ncbi:Hydrophobic protein OSR8-like protein [Drosera capensis]
MASSSCAIFCEILLAILLPPLGVFFRHGCCSIEFCICLLLTILGYIPGIIYAIYAIVVVDRDRDRDPDGDIHYYRVA